MAYRVNAYNISHFSYINFKFCSVPLNKSRFRRKVLLIALFSIWFDVKLSNLEYTYIHLFTNICVHIKNSTDFCGFHNTPHLQNMLGKFAGEPLGDKDPKMVSNGNVLVLTWILSLNCQEIRYYLQKMPICICKYVGQNFSYNAFS